MLFDVVYSSTWARVAAPQLLVLVSAVLTSSVKTMRLPQSLSAMLHGLAQTQDAQASSTSDRRRCCCSKAHKLKSLHKLLHNTAAAIMCRSRRLLLPQQLQHVLALCVEGRSNLRLPVLCTTHMCNTAQHDTAWHNRHNPLHTLMVCAAGLSIAPAAKPHKQPSTDICCVAHRVHMFQCSVQHGPAGQVSLMHPAGNVGGSGRRPQSIYFTWVRQGGHSRTPVLQQLLPQPGSGRRGGGGGQHTTHHTSPTQCMLSADTTLSGRLCAAASTDKERQCWVSGCPMLYTAKNSASVCVTATHHHPTGIQPVNNRAPTCCMPRHQGSLVCQPLYLQHTLLLLLLLLLREIQ